MTDWSEPQDAKQWLGRALSIRPVMVMILILGLLVSELRFDWMEQAVGAYLATTNDRRGESGAVWELGRRTQTAREALERIVTDRQSSQRDARSALSLIEVADGLESEHAVMLSSDHFRELYLKLSPEIARQWLSPYDLLSLSSGGQWERTYVKKTAAGLIVYLLDGKNRVLRNLKMSDDLMQHIRQGGQPMALALEDVDRYAGRIYPAGRFFGALNTLPDAVRIGVVTQPEALLAAGGPIVRVGVADETVSGFIELGFEVREGSRLKVLAMQGHEWAVWQLRRRLEGRTPKRTSFDPMPGSGSAK